MGLPSCHAWGSRRSPLGSLLPSLVRYNQFFKLNQEMPPKKRQNKTKSVEKVASSQHEVEVPSASQQTNYSFIDTIANLDLDAASQELETLHQKNRLQLFKTARRFGIKPGQGKNADIASRLREKLEELIASQKQDSRTSSHSPISQRGSPATPRHVAPPATQESLPNTPIVPLQLDAVTKLASRTGSPAKSGFMFDTNFKLPNLLSPSHAGSAPPVHSTHPTHREPVKLGTKQLRNKLKEKRLRAEGIKQRK